jgi:three-Cys-motif partner protein
MSAPLQQFGGSWTDEKLDRLRRYLAAYQQALKGKPFTRYYIDAFAGTGYNMPKSAPEDTSPLFDVLVSPDTRKFVDGSARIALQTKPPFDRYIFVERDTNRFAELTKLRRDFPDLKERIDLVNDEANSYLTSLCRSANWIADHRRGVVFLDPFGMQVTWGTIQAIAETQAIDLWLLFPLGIGVMRMLPNHGQVPPAWRRRLDSMFGEPDWYAAFYETLGTLFGGADSVAVKRADYTTISRYFVKRLRTAFGYVAENPCR